MRERAPTGSPLWTIGANFQKNAIFSASTERIEMIFGGEVGNSVPVITQKIASYLLLPFLKYCDRGTNLLNVGNIAKWSVGEKTMRVANDETSETSAPSTNASHLWLAPAETARQTRNIIF